MKPFSATGSARSAVLRLRTQQERERFLTLLSDVEGRLQRVDNKVEAVRRFVTKPAVVACGTVLLLLLRRAGGKWRWLSRGVVIATTARQVFEAFRRR